MNLRLTKPHIIFFYHRIIRKKNFKTAYPQTFFVMNSEIEFSSVHQLAQPLVSYPVSNRYRGDIFDIFSEFSGS